MTRNAINTFFESQRRVPRGSGDSSVQAWLENQAGPDEESAEWDREYQRQGARLRDRAGPPRIRGGDLAAFAQTALEGRPAKDVAAGLGMTVGAVYIARSRVLSRIKDEVRKLLDE